jgi:D-alanine transaminase
MVFLNGRYMPVEEARVPVLDRGFIFGDGVYELVPVYSRIPFRLDEHLARLERSLAAVRIRDPYGRAEWREILLNVIARQPFEDQGVYFQVTRGVARRDHAFPKDVAPTVFVMSNPLVTPPQQLVERGAAAVSAVDDRWLHCDIKSISLIGNCLLRQVSADAGAVETILFRDGKLTEASSSNVFVVRGGAILSPPKSNLILPGITYDVVVELAQGAGMPLEFRAITDAEVRAADEIWVTSSS